eukprot:145945_1
MRKLINNECYTILDQYQYFNDPHNFLNKKSRFLDLDDHKKSVIDPMREFQRAATFAWHNNRRLPFIRNMVVNCCGAMVENEGNPNFKWINDARSHYLFCTTRGLYINETEKCKLSSLYLMNFIYKVRKCGLSRNCELRTLILQLIASGGALGFRYMIWFYFKEFVVDPIKKGGKTVAIGIFEDGTVFETL